MLGDVISSPQCQWKNERLKRSALYDEVFILFRVSQYRNLRQPNEVSHLPFSWISYEQQLSSFVVSYIVLHRNCVMFPYRYSVSLDTKCFIAQLQPSSDKSQRHDTKYRGWLKRLLVMIRLCCTLQLLYR